MDIDGSFTIMAIAPKIPILGIFCVFRMWPISLQLIIAAPFLVPLFLQRPLLKKLFVNLFDPSFQFIFDHIVFFHLQFDSYFILEAQRLGVVALVRIYGLAVPEGPLYISDTAGPFWG